MPRKKKKSSVARVIARYYRPAGLAILALIYVWAYLTRKDPFWAGRATFFGLFVLLAVAFIDMVVKNAVEKS